MTHPRDWTQAQWQAWNRMRGHGSTIADYAREIERAELGDASPAEAIGAAIFGLMAAAASGAFMGALIMWLVMR